MTVPRLPDARQPPRPRCARGPSFPAAGRRQRRRRHCAPARRGPATGRPPGLPAAGGQAEFEAGAAGGQGAGKHAMTCSPSRWHWEARMRFMVARRSLSRAATAPEFGFR
jgi:hypothetical protein